MTQPVQQPTAPGGTVTAAKLAALLVLIDAQARLRLQLTQAAVAAAVAAFEALTDWWDAAKVDKAITAALKVVRPSQVQMARLTASYLARSASEITGRRVSPAGAVDVTRLRRAMSPEVARELVAGQRTPLYLYLGEHDPDRRRVIPGDGMDTPAVTAVPNPNQTVSQRREQAQRIVAEAASRWTPPAEPYGRVADGYRYDVVARGATEAKARQKALVRIATVAATDITLAVREQYYRSMGELRDVRGWRRIVRPEMSETGPCGLCVVAADRVYKRDDLLPIHNGCVCEVLPILGELDPGLVLNTDELEAIYNAAGGTGGEVIKRGRRHSGALQKIRVALGESGELGPVLVNADQKHRGPREVAATKVPDRATRARAQLEALDRQYAIFLRKQQNGENVDKALAWQEQAIEKLRRELAGAA